MKPFIFLLAACAAFAQSSQPNVTNARFETRAFSGNLHSQIRSANPAWFGYVIKAVPGDRENCGNCCFLEEKSSSSRADTPVHLEPPDALALLFRVANNTVQKIRALPLSCPLDAGGLPFIWLSGVPARDSISYLENLVSANPADRLVGSAIFAISQHDDSQADEALAHLTNPAQPEEVRAKTTFWLGASRGARGVAILKNILAGDPSASVRDKAVFALSVSKQPEAFQTLIDTAKRDPSPHVRGQALFWLAQKAGARASATIVNAIENDPDTEVKKRAVFALSRLPKDESVPKLIEIARTQRNPQVRKQAFFWLGQSKDPRALAFFEQVLSK